MDSLNRYDLSHSPDILVVDEIESILERVYSCRDNSGIDLKFLKLIQCAKTVVFMDGLIEKKTIENLNRFRNCQDPDVIRNAFSPRAEYTYIIY